MLTILETPELLSQRDRLMVKFNEKRKDISFLGTPSDFLKEIEEWKFSTGDIFDIPPYGHEMDGFNGGRILKKKYVSPYEARVKGAYSSGFIAGKVRLIVHPSKPLDMPLVVSKLEHEDDVVRKYHAKYFDHQDKQSTKLQSLISLSEFYAFKEGVRANITISDGEAYSIVLYYYDAYGRITAASMVSAPFSFQSEYEMHYGDDNELIAITTGGVPHWSKDRSV